MTDDTGESTDDFSVEVIATSARIKGKMRSKKLEVNRVCIKKVYICIATHLQNTKKCSYKVTQSVC